MCSRLEEDVGMENVLSRSSVRDYAVQATTWRPMTGEYRQHVTTSNAMTSKAMTSMRKILWMGLFGAFVCVAVFYLLGSTGTARADNRSIHYIVQPGDTLWRISSTAGNAKQDTQGEVLKIMDINHMKDANILPGQVILVPQQ